METAEEYSERLAAEAREPGQGSDEDSEEHFNPWAVPAAAAPVAAPVAPDHYRGLPATPTETDPATGRLVATTPRGSSISTVLILTWGPRSLPLDTLRRLRGKRLLANDSERRMAHGEFILTNGVV